jgi:hypothetical protein
VSTTEITREQVIQEFWYRGNLKFKLHAAQKQLNEIYNKITGQIFVGNCSRQWGKSYWSVCKSIEQAIKTPKSQIRYCAAFQSDLVDFIIPAFDKILDDAPLSIKGKKVGHYYVFPNKSRIKLVGLDKNPNGARGNTLDLIIIDECGFVSNLDYVYKSVIIPATLHRKNCKVILMSTPPSTPAHEFVDYCQKAEQEGSYVKLDIYTNPLITTDDIERMAKEMGGKDSTTFRRECLCEFITDGDLAIVSEWNDDFIQDIPRDEYYVHYQKYVCMDMGRKDHTALSFGYYDFKKAALVIEDELTMQGTEWTTETLKKDLLSREKELWGEQKPYRRIADNNNPHLIIDLNSMHKVYFIETTKESLEAMVNEVRMFVGKGRLIINPRCKMLIGCLKYGVWDKHRKEFARSKVYGHFDHLAGLIYLVRNLDQITNPIPLMHGRTPHRTFTRGVGSKLTPNEQLIKNIFTPKKTSGF